MPLTSARASWLMPRDSRTLRMKAPYTLRILPYANRYRHRDGCCRAGADPAQGGESIGAWSSTLGLPTASPGPVGDARLAEPGEPGHRAVVVVLGGQAG